MEKSRDKEWKYMVFFITQLLPMYSSSLRESGIMGGKVYLDELDHFKQNWSKNIFPALVSQVWFNLFAWTGLIDRDSALRVEIASIKLLELTEQCGAVWCFSSVRDAVLGHLQTLAEPFNDIRGKGNITCRVITSDTWYLRWKLSVCTTSW